VVCEFPSAFALLLSCFRLSRALFLCRDALVVARVLLPVALLIELLMPSS
jgi:hypothetical protein